MIITSPITTLTEDAYPDIFDICNFIKIKYREKMKRLDINTILLNVKFIASHERKKRFYKINKLKFDKHTMMIFDKLPIYEARESQKKISQKNRRRHQKITSLVCDELTGVYEREPTAKVKFDFSDKKVTYLQSYGHVDNLGRIIPNTTLNSNILKRQYSVDRPYNINLARVDIITKANGIQYGLTRSGRSDSPSRLIKLIQWTFLSALNSSNQRGITYDKDGKPHFQLSLYTGQCPHPINNFFKIVDSDKKIPLDEGTSLMDIKRTIQSIWNDSNSVQIKVTTINDKELVFFAHQPILKNFVLTISAEDENCIKISRKWSRPSVLKEFHLLRCNEKVTSHSCFQEAFSWFNEKFDINIVPSKQNVKEFLSEFSDFFKQLKPKDIYARKIYYALKAICISMNHTDFFNKAFLSEASPGIALLYHYDLSELINSNVAVQCKAGCDRALIMTSLFLAKTQIEKKHRQNIDLDELDVDNEVHNEFVEEFKSFCTKFGRPIINICRGSQDLKAMEKPIVKYLLGDNLTRDSIPGLKLVGGT